MFLRIRQFLHESSDLFFRSVFFELEAESVEFLDGLDETVKADPKFAEKVKQLETFYDEEMGAESGDDVQDWFERQNLNNE